MNTSIQHPEPNGLVQPSRDSSQSEATLSAWRNPSGPFVWVALLAGLLFLLFSAPSARADRNPPGCLGSGLGISLFTSLPDVHIGDTIYYSVNVFNASFPACDAGATNPAVAGAIRAWVVTPDGVTNNLTLRRTYLAPGDSDSYPNVVSYVVRTQDIRPDGSVRATAYDEGDIHQNDTNSRGGGNQGVNTEVNIPCIRITAQCVSSVGESGAITFTGTVTNCGNNTLVGVTVTNFVNGGQFHVTFLGNLAIGQVASFSGSWIPSNPCLPSTATLVARGTDEFTSTPQTVTSSATITCQNALTPGIKVTKVCPTQPVFPGQLLTFSGSVSNTGNVTLTNIVVVNNQPAPNTPVFTRPTLAPGEVVSFNGSYTAPINCSVADTLTATASSRCGVGVSSTASATCPILTTPQIAVTVPCPVTPAAPGGTLTYSGTVSNAGNITLTNIVVVNNQSAAITNVLYTNSGPFTFGTIAISSLKPPVWTVTDRFVIGTNFNGLTYAGENHGYGATEFYSMRKDTTGVSFFDTIIASTANTTDRFNASNRTFDALTYAAGDVGYGPLLFYYLSHDNAGVSTFGSITPGGAVGVVADHFVVGSNFDALTYTATDVGYGANMFYYVRHDSNGRSTFGTINPALPGTVTDRFIAGTNFDALVFTTTDVGYGLNLFYYLRHDASGVSTFGTIRVTGLTTATVTDRFTVGTNATELTFTATDVGFGPNRFYFLRTGGSITGTNTPPQPAFTLPSLAPGASANFTSSVTVPTNACSVTTTFTGTGNDICTTTTVTNIVSTTCPIATASAVAVTLACPTAPVATGGLITYTGTVRNSGNVTLNNVSVVNSQSVPSIVLTVPSLAPGASANFTASFTAPADACSVSSTVTASGSDNCTQAVVNNSASATCTLVTTPRIAVTQSCPANPPSLGGVLTYSGTVSNAGNITLTNVVVTNDRTGTSPVFTVATLAPGASTNFTGSYMVPANSGCAITSTLTANGRDKCTATLVTANAAATCPVQGAPNIAVTLACPVTPTPLGGLLTFSGTVSNAGNVTLTNVVVLRDAPAPNTVVFSVASLASGASANFTGSYTVPGSNACSITTSVSASANDQCAGSGVIARATISCPLFTTPRIIVTQNCTTNPTGPGGVLTYSGTVCNAGNITLTNIVVSNNQTAAPIITTNNTAIVTTNTPGTIATNTTVTVTTNAATPVSFGTINSVSHVVVDRFVIGNDFNGLTYAGEDHGYAATQFYSMRKANTGTSFFDTITASTATTTDRFDASTRNFDALAYAAPDLGYGPVIFYYLSHDNTGVSTFGSITPGGTVGVTADHFVVGSNFDALTFAVTDVGYGANLFYYVRHDATGLSTFGTINPALPGTITDRFTVGTNVDALVFTDLSAPGYGANNFYYLRHDASGVSTFGTIFVTGLTTATVTDRFTVGTNATELTFTATDAGSFGPNLFYFLRGRGLNFTTNSLTTYTTNTTTTFTTNIVTTYTTNTQPPITVSSLAPGACTNFTGSYLVPGTNVCSVTAIITATASDICSGNTVTNTITATCPLTTAPRIAVTLNCPVVPAAIGGLVTYTGTVSNPGNVTLNNVVVVNNQASPSTVLTVPSLAPGASANFTASFTAPANACSVSSTVTASGSDACTASMVTNVASATCPLTTAPRIAVTLNCPVVPAAIGGLVTYTGTVSNPGNVTLNNVVVVNNQASPSTVLTMPSLAPGAFANFTASFTALADTCSVSSTVIASGSDACTAIMVTNVASATCTLVTAPRIVVTQNCPANPASPGSVLTYSGSVSNAGNITLTNVVVTNDRTGTSPVFAVATLAPGASANFTGSYPVPANSACDITSTLSGSGYDECSGIRVTASASSTCPLLTAPAIVVTQFCPTTPVLQGGILTYSGTVSNAGNVTLTNIVVVNNRPAANTVIFTVATLAPGARTNFTGSYQVPLNCCVVSSTVGATGRDICTGVTVADTFTATCIVLTVPQIVVTKVCPPTAVRPGEMLQYSGIVSNAGNITLVNVTIVNTQPRAGSPVWGPITLAPGESVSYYGSYLVVPDFCGTDTVTARGLDACTFAPVVNSVTTTCPIITTPRIAVTKNCPSQTTPRGGVFTFTGTVSNPGNVTLTNVVVVNNYQVDCYSRTNGPVIGPITLPPGAIIIFSGSYTAPRACCEVVDTLTASGQDRCAGTRVAATATALCPLLSTPRITVTRVCPNLEVPVGGVFTYSGSVSNAGDVVLTNVYVLSSKPNANTSVLGPIELAPGETKVFSGSYTVTANSNPATDTVTARGTDTCQGRTVTAMANCFGPVFPLTIISVTLTNGVATITWAATPGTTYTLQYKTTLQDPSWISIPGNVTASGNTASRNDAVGSTTQRFYRVMVVP
jgi:uncharacterized repeat protein (TIGR01451 family)